MNDIYFVMLTTPSGRSTPLNDNSDRMAFFVTLDDAKQAALSSALGSECGYEVFELGGGVFQC